MHDSHQYIPSNEKFALYNNWDSQEWKQAEKMHRPAYRTGDQEFYLFEESDLYLIDAWHPTEFLYHDTLGTVWETGAWPWLIILTVEQYHRSFLQQNQSSKSYNLEWEKESNSMKQVINRYDDHALYLKFDALLDEKEFLNSIQNIDRQIKLNLDMPLVKKLWNKWYEQSIKVWK
jgi:hypothetical protein